MATERGGMPAAEAKLDPPKICSAIPIQVFYIQTSADGASVAGKLHETCAETLLQHSKLLPPFSWTCRLTSDPLLCIG